ncbi:MAG TPA: hypothetical protein VFX97_12095 [Pyrinomonadaceae bacterium]|nr:hypothetical protein [Pyrinomonadaceae bacterium]
MTPETKPARVLYENLDTSFVNVWALLRYLSQRSFIGRVHVELENYSADVFVNGSETPMVHEIDRDAGTDVVEEAALHRLVLRVRESSGSINVYEGVSESIPPQTVAVESPPPADEIAPVTELQAATPEAMRSSAAKDEEETVMATDTVTVVSQASDGEWSETVRVSGELIAALERAATSLGADFDSLFRETRISLADDYAFLDPMTGQLRYENSSVTVNRDSQPQGYVAGVSEALRRVVDQIATGERERRTRERIALELARVARKHNEALARSGFSEQLDRIAGTKVI